MKDRFGNEIDAEANFAWGSILKRPVDLFYKALWVECLVTKRIKEKGPDSISRFQGSANVLPLLEEDVRYAGPEFTGWGFFRDELTKAVLDFLGGDPGKHGVALFNRTSAGIVCAMLVMAKKGTKVLLYGPRKSHSSIILGVKLAQAEAIEVFNLADYKEALAKWQKELSLVVITPISVNIVLMPNQDLEEAVRLSKDRGLPIFLDHAWANYTKEILGGPLSLELDVDVATKSMQKSSVYGPRGGIMAGKRELVEKIQSLGCELGMDMRPIVAVSCLRGLENYDPEECRRTKAYGDEIYKEAAKRFGKERAEWSEIGGFVIELEDCLDILMERSSDKGKPVLVPLEAAVATAVALVEDYGIVTTGAWGPYGCVFCLRIKPIYSERKKVTAEEVVDAVDVSIDRIAKICGDRKEIAKVLFGSYMDRAFEG